MRHPEFAERFNQAVKQAGVKNTQKHLSKLLGVSEVMIWSYKNGEKLPRMSTAVRICDILGISVNWLLQGKLPIYEQHPAYETSDKAIPKVTKVAYDLITFIQGLSESQQQEALALFKQHFSEKLPAPRTD